MVRFSGGGAAQKLQYHPLEPHRWATIISILASTASLLHIDGNFLRHALAGERNVCSVGAL